MQDDGFDGEMLLVCLIKKIQAHGFAPSNKDVCCLAYELAEAFKLDHKFCHTKKEAGNGWYTLFVRRHPELILSDEVLSKCNTNKYFALLEKILNEHNLFDKPANLFSMVVECLKKYQGNTVTMSLIACSNALGQFLPPVCTLKAQSNMEKFEVDTPPGTVVFPSSESALVDSKRFLMWLRDHFAPKMPTGKSVLILDARSTFCFSFDVWNFVKQNDIILLGLPPGKELQPLNEAFSRTLMAIFYASCNPFKRFKNDISQKAFSKIQTKEWIKATNAKNTISRFEAAGIYPYVPVVEPESKLPYQKLELESDSKNSDTMITPSDDDNSEKTDNESCGSQRKILTLEERVRAIEADVRKPNYTKVARMFHCGRAQFKNSISSRKAIQDFYEEKVAFLVECMNEYVQRARFYPNAILTEEVINAKAIEFCELIQIQSFRFTKLWINQFKVSGNISLSQRQIFQKRLPSLDLKDIMTYCSCNKILQHGKQDQIERPLNKLKIANSQHIALEQTKEIDIDITSASSKINNEMLRQCKIDLLEKALYEYMQRSQYHHKIQLNQQHLIEIAFQLKGMLKIDYFFPNKRWFNIFKFNYNFSTSQRMIIITRTPPLSLDLKDILSYCSRMDLNNLSANSTVLHQDNILVAQAAPMAVLSENEEDAKMPNIAQIKIEPQGVQTAGQPGAKTARADDSEPVRTQETEQRIAPESSAKPVLEGTSKTVSGPSLARLPTTTSMSLLKPKLKPTLECKEEPGSDDEVLPTSLEIHNKKSLHEHSNSDQEQPMHSLGHWSEARSDNEELPKHPKSYTEALRLLKPLEEFAMLEENYRAIGLLIQLEDVLKNPSKSAS